MIEFPSIDQSPKSQIYVLTSQLREWDYWYYVLHESLVYDQTYDRVMRKLRALEEAYPELLSPDSPTQVVGGGFPTEAEKLDSPRPGFGADRGKIIIREDFNCELDAEMEDA